MFNKLRSIEVKITVLDGSATWLTKTGVIANTTAKDKLFFTENKTGSKFEFNVLESNEEDGTFKTAYGFYKIDVI